MKELKIEVKNCKKESIEIMTLTNEAFRRICNNKSIIINANDKPEKVHDNIIKK